MPATRPPLFPDRRHPGTLRVRPSERRTPLINRQACCRERFRCTLAKKRRKREWKNSSLGQPKTARWKPWCPQFQVGSPGTGLGGPGHSPSACGGGRLPGYPGSSRLRSCVPLWKSAASRAFTPIRPRPSTRSHAGRNVVIVTPTASGKTLCYNLPVLNLLMRRPGRARHVPVPHQGAGRGSASRIPGRRG